MNNIKIKLTRLVVTIIFGLSLSLLVSSCENTRSGEIEVSVVSIENEIPDKNLMKAIKEELGVSKITDKNILNLTILDASDRNISSIAGIKYAKNLESLNLSENHLTIIDPGTFDNLTNLHELNLYHNQLADINPKTFKGLANLQTLWITDNQLTTIGPGTFDGLANLQELYLGYNQLKNIDPMIFNGLTKLQKLDLSDNQLTSLESETFRYLTNLQELILSYNKLSNKDLQSLKTLTNLQILGLTGNQLTEIGPETFNGLANLQIVYLDENQLTNLDIQTFGSLTNLQGLSLGSNQLTNIDFIKNLNLTKYKDLSNQTIYLKMKKRIQELPIKSSNPKFVKIDESDKYKIKGNKIILDDDYVEKEIKIKFITDDMGNDEGIDIPENGFSGTIIVDTSNIEL